MCQCVRAYVPACMRARECITSGVRWGRGGGGGRGEGGVGDTGMEIQVMCL